jgi:hypothetical protein
MFVLRESLDFFKLGDIATGGRQLVLCENDFGWFALEVEIGNVSIALAVGLCYFGWATWMKASVIAKGGQ